MTASASLKQLFRRMTQAKSHFKWVLGSLLLIVVLQILTEFEIYIYMFEIN